MMMFIWTNKQPGTKSFEIHAVSIKISMTEYHHLNILTQQSMGKMSKINLVIGMSAVHFFEALKAALCT